MSGIPIVGIGDSFRVRYCRITDHVYNPRGRELVRNQR